MISRHNTIYNNRFTTIYSKDYEKWYLDRDCTQPVDESKIKCDDGDSFFVLLIGLVLIVLMVVDYYRR